jgi:hypothetical protein
MNVTERIEALVALGNHMTGTSATWMEAKQRAHGANGWFVPEFVDLAASNIATHYLNRETLTGFAERYAIPEQNVHPRNVGIVMAGNIPMVGFHDLLCTFLTGHIANIKPSSKDEVLMGHLAGQLSVINSAAAPYFVTRDMLKGCDAYIATGSNNTSRYFDHYFGKYAHIIRKNRTSVAILTGSEDDADLDKLADDVHQYFGLGCRNVTKLYVPNGYDFVPLLEAFKKYSYFENHHKYKNNYDHNLAMHILNNRHYMTNGSSVLLVEDASLFSPIAQLHYGYYEDVRAVEDELKTSNDVQSIVGAAYTPFGMAQRPDIGTFADGVNTMDFLVKLAPQESFR